ncbi:MAG: carboxypeptidase regulatory-like domain-containing protein [Planctomycetes bacterium]|nr:carboxypeptidase regulatory-like domain-containing protein [Planctomycetota bacterium]MCB9885043.1 carboxypeptidase regulatory-like domain-containing protein [Planctomycetota bacterium]
MSRTLLLTLLSLVLGSLPAQAPARTAALPLQGRLFDELGEPVPAATVEVWRDGRLTHRTATDAVGRFLLVGVPVGQVEVTLAAPGKATVRRPHLLVPGRQVLVAELCDAVRLSGRVLDAAGRPVADAVVLLFADGRSEARSDARGEFVFPTARVGRGVLRAFGPQSFGALDTDVQEGARIEVRLPRAGIASRLVRVHGLPEATARLAHVRVVSFEGMLSPAAGRVALAADGTAAVQVLSTSLVELVAPGFVTSPRGALVENAALTPIELHAVAVAGAMPARAVLRGRAEDEQERPVGGIALRVETFDDQIVGRGTIAADGTFAVPLELAANQPFRVCVERGEFYVGNVGARLRGRDCEVTLPRADAELVLLLERGGDVVAQARTQDGERPMLREVHVACADRPWSTFVPTYCDENGCFELRGLPADEYLLRTSTDGGEVLWATARVRTGRVTEALQWHSAAGGTVQGRVLVAGGAPVGGMVLRLWQCNRPDAMAATADAWCTVRTDRLGRYRRAALPPGEWRLVADGSDAIAPVAFDVRAGSAETAELPVAAPPR